MESPIPSKETSSPVQLLRHIHKTFTKRENFVARLPKDIFLPPFTAAAAEADGSWDQGLIEAVDTLLEIAFAAREVIAPLPAHAKEAAAAHPAMLRVKELESLLPKLYAEKGLREAGIQSLQKELAKEKLLRKELNERLKEIERENEGLRRNLEEQARTILEFSMTSEIDQAPFDSQSFEKGASFGVLTDSAFPAKEEEEPQSLLHTEESPSQDLASTIPFSKLVHRESPAQEQQQSAQTSETSETTQSTQSAQSTQTTQSTQPSQQPENQPDASAEVTGRLLHLAVMLEDHLSLLTSQATNESEARKGIEASLLSEVQKVRTALAEEGLQATQRDLIAQERFQQLQRNLDQQVEHLHTQLADKQAAIGEDLQKITAHLGQIDSKLDEKTLAEQSPQISLLASLNQFSDKLDSLVDEKAKRKRQLRAVGKSLEEIEAALAICTPTFEDASLYEKIQKRIQQIAKEIGQLQQHQAKDSTSQYTEKEQALEITRLRERRDQLFLLCQDAYSLIAFLFSSLIQIARIVATLPKLAPLKAPAILLQQLSFSDRAAVVDIQDKLRTLIQTAESFSPELVVYLEDRLSPST